MDNGERITRRLATLKAERLPNETVWQECFLWTDPVSGAGLTGPQMLNASEIASAVAKIFDSTAIDAKRTLAASIVSGLTPANSQWLKLKVDGSDADGDRWLDQSSETLWINIHDANFDSEGSDGVNTMMGGGWFVLYIEEDLKNGGYHFEHWPLAECFISSSKQGGRIDTVYRSYKLTAEQAVAKFKQRGDNLPKAIIDAAENEPDKKFDFIHCIEPRATYMVNARLAKNMPVASYQYSCEGKQVVRESGYNEMPCVVPRWKKIPSSHYAVGPVLDALPDIRTVNDIVKLELANLDLAVAGMWIAKDDGVLNPRTVKIGARKIIVANDTDSIKPLQPAANFQLADTRILALQGQIRKTLMADQLQPQEGPAMTATEVHVRVDLIRQLLGPIYGRLQAEYLQGLVERCFGIAYRAGALGVAPDSLAGRPFTVQYQNPLARAQKLEEVTAVERYMGDLSVMAQVDPTVMDNVDTDEAARVTGKGLGVPSSIIRTPEEVTAYRQKKQAAQQNAQQQQLGMEAQADVQKQVGGAVAQRMVAQ